MRRIFTYLLALSLVAGAGSAFAAEKRTVISKTSCCCTSSIKGNYRFFIDPAGSGGGLDSTGPFTATFTQSGCTVVTNVATSNGYRIYGTITGNQFKFSMVVDGEEAEGYVLQGEGIARGSIIAAVYHDTNGVTGSWTAGKQP